MLLESRYLRIGFKLSICNFFLFKKIYNFEYIYIWIIMATKVSLILE